MSFKVIDPGMIALVQDGGRAGYQHLGVTTGGPMDEHAFDWANWLLGNPRGSAALEITYGMLVLEALSDMTFALAGADLGATLNGKPLLPWQQYQVQAGDRLKFGTPENGLRAYLAFPGGIQTVARLGSAATVTREKLGGLDGSGKPLQRGDRLLSMESAVAEQRAMPDWAIPDYSEPLKMGLILGYQYECFSITQRMKFFTAPYTVTSNIDRMGYRLQGEPVASEQNGIISEGIALGAVQIPQDGQPIVLMRDRQTIGGYPKIGCVFSLDLAKLAQRKPGDIVEFRLMDVAEAENRRMLYDRQFNH
ncbi:5-oxoprolinase subunit C family protein [Marinobacterium marinum]|uniref:Biotin-dependent carboxyltransferase n=1 Tax=Marinobacterium marinum TaxID=2756129 RepID=A0A7W1WZE7_9GAMM|nr:biotin-dependent carboxyltransferase family protein [Marinobacterium marinum]MBA4503026.1 biotin-dependent carboxyltransferase [Marinobacterium marinum]